MILTRFITKVLEGSCRERMPQKCKLFKRTEIMDVGIVIDFSFPHLIPPPPRSFPSHFFSFIFFLKLKTLIEDIIYEIISIIIKGF